MLAYRTLQAKCFLYTYLVIRADATGKVLPVYLAWLSDATGEVLPVYPLAFRTLLAKCFLLKMILKRKHKFLDGEKKKVSKVGDSISAIVP